MYRNYNELGLSGWKLGNTSIIRDWGWAPEYVEAMWLMLQQANAEDYVIATGESNRLEDFVAEAFGCVGSDWRDHVVADPSLLRPTEIAVGRGIPAKAQKQLNWQAKYKMKNVVQMMVQEELSWLQNKGLELLQRG